MSVVPPVELSRDGRLLRTMRPEKRQYLSSQMPMTEAAIDAGLTRDVYVSLGEPLDNRGAWSLRVYYKPFVDWIWGGCLLMALGVLVAMSDRRYRLRAKAGMALAGGRRGMIRTPILRAALLSLALNWSGMASAREAAPMAADIEIEKRMVAICEELRCLVCQNESLAGSHAELAEELGREIRKKDGLERTTVTRSDRDTYRHARDAEWGGIWPPQDD